MYFRLDLGKTAGHTPHKEYEPAKYLVDHSTAIFIFDVEGKPRLHADADSRTVETLIHDVALLIQE